MGLMIGQRAVACGLSTPEDICLSRVRHERREIIETALSGSRILTENAAAVADAELVVLAVKPKSFGVVADEIRDDQRQSNPRQSNFFNELMRSGVLIVADQATVINAFRRAHDKVSRLAPPIG